MPKSPEAPEEFDRRLADEQAKGRKARLEDAPGIGVLPDGTLNIVNPDDPLFEPCVIGGDGED